MSKSIFRMDEELFEEIRDYSIAYCQYVKSGGCISVFTDTMIEKTIDAVMKIKAHRDYIDESMGREIIKYDKRGERKQKKVRSKVSKAKVQANQVAIEPGERCRPYQAA